MCLDSGTCVSAATQITSAEYSVRIELITRNNTSLIMHYGVATSLFIELKMRKSGEKRMFLFCTNDEMRVLPGKLWAHLKDSQSGSSRKQESNSLFPGLHSLSPSPFPVKRKEKKSQVWKLKKILMNEQQIVGNRAL